MTYVHAHLGDGGEDHTEDDGDERDVGREREAGAIDGVGGDDIEEWLRRLARMRDRDGHDIVAPVGEHFDDDGEETERHDPDPSKRT